MVVVVSAIPVPPPRADHGRLLGARTPLPRLDGSLIRQSNPVGRSANADSPGGRLGALTALWVVDRRWKATDWMREHLLLATWAPASSAILRPSQLQAIPPLDAPPTQ